MATADRFHRWRHLAFAGVALLHGPLAISTVVVPLLVDTGSATAQLDVLDRLIPLCFVAFVAWLAFDRFDTHSGVTLLPRRWADTGALVVAVFLAREVLVISELSHKTDAAIDSLTARWTDLYTGSNGDLMLGWVVMAVLVTALAEELVYRALLLRALEGFMGRWTALIVHAAVFELVHVYIYGYGFQAGQWFVMALILGYAFQRTHAVAVSVAMHATSLLIFYVAVWWLAR